MNGFVPAVLGGILLIGIIIVLLFIRKASRQKKAMQSMERRAAGDVPAAVTALAAAVEKRGESGSTAEVKTPVVATEKKSIAVEGEIPSVSEAFPPGESGTESVDAEPFPQEEVPDVAVESEMGASDSMGFASPEKVPGEDAEPEGGERAAIFGEKSKETRKGAPPLPVEPPQLLVRMSVEDYADRLNALEEGHRAALTEAITRNDEVQRDQLQRELVIMNDRLALLADSYVKDMACYQQVLDELLHLQKERSDPALDKAIDELQSGETQTAATVLEGLSKTAHPFAMQAAYLHGQLAECRVDLYTAMDCYRQAVTRDPENLQYLRAAGLVARSLYKTKEALPWLERYVRLTKEGGHASPKAVALAQRELAYTYVLNGQYQKAGPLYKESMTVLAQRLGQDHPEMAISWQQIGEFQETMGEYDKAVSLYKKALAILEKKRGPEHPALAGILGKLAALCMELEMEPEAVPLYERLVRIQEKALRPTHPQLMISLNNLAEAYHLQRRYAEAEACYLKTLRVNEEMHGKEHPSVAAILQELAKLCTSQRKMEEARQYQERASTIFQKSVDAAGHKAGEEALTLELS